MPRKTGRTRALPPSDGAAVCRWIEAFLVTGAGDELGEPLRLTDDQARVVYRIEERRPDGRYRVRQALIGRPKGVGKSTLAAALALSRLAGPVAPRGAEIPIGAANYAQSDVVFETICQMVREGPLSGLLDVQEHQILRLDAPGRIYRIAAVAGTNDGGRPNLVIADELHEWLDNKARVWTILVNGVAKRRDGQAIAITTAGDNLETLCGQLYRLGQDGTNGDVSKDGFYFDWIEAGEEVDLTTRKGVTSAVKGVYGDALGRTIDLEAIMGRHRELDLEGRGYEFERYFLNRWTSSPKRWLPTGTWEALAKPRTVAAGERVVFGFDGSYSADSTALVGATLDGYVWVEGVWERPKNATRDWVVPRDEVEAAVHHAMARYKVLELACDPPGWDRELRDWGERYDTIVASYATNRRSLMAPACAMFYSAVVRGEIQHDGNRVLAEHLANAIVRETAEGALITKDYKGSPRKIDAAVGAVVAYARAQHHAAEPTWDGPIIEVLVP